MGLLTDPSAGQGKIIKFLLKYYTKFCLVLYIAGIIYFCLLASPQLNNGTYFSENALLPGLVKSEFKYDGNAMEYHDELLEEMKKYEESLPYPWLLAKLRQIGLDTYTHEFALNYPLGPKQVLKGKNVYGILRAPRAASTEALVLSVPYRPPVSIHETTAPSIAIMLAFAKYAIKEKYWAKDIIFLITEHEQIGMQAWLESYHGINMLRNDSLLMGEMKGRAGAIQAAINLELHHTEIAQIDIKIEGLNGQLPNLDLFNLAARMCLKEGVHLTFKNRATSTITSNPFRDWNLSLNGLKVLPRKLRVLYKHWRAAFDIYIRMVGTHASGIPNGNHGLYYRFGIQAVTLEGFGPENNRASRVGFYTIGRILEGTFRSLNNLLERFHQSYFFYLLAGHDRYISIGLYIPAICLVVATLFIKAYAKWCQLHDNKNVQNGDVPEKRRLTANEVRVLEEKYARMTMDDWMQRFNEDSLIETKNNLSLGHICLIFVLVHILGFSLRGFPKYVSNWGVLYGFSIDASIFGGTAIICVASTIAAVLIPRPCHRSMTFLSILALIELGTSLLCVAMYNISLAMFLSTVYIPFAMIINPCRCKIYNFIQKLCWLLVHPLNLLLIVVYTYSVFSFSNNEPMYEVFVRTLNSSMKALRFSIEDSMFYGNWLYNFLSCIMLPVWMCFWYVSFAPIEQTSLDKKKLE